MLLEDSLRGVDVVSEFEGPIVDVGSGGGVPGIPLAVSLPDREVTLLEAIGRKCDFLREWAQPNVRVVQGRAEEQETDVYGVAVAKGTGEAAGRGRMVLAARSSGRRCGALGGTERGHRARRAGGGTGRRGTCGIARRAPGFAQSAADTAGLSTPNRGGE